ncbi:MAG: nucleotidyltransferase [Nitrospirota bacterium]
MIEGENLIDIFIYEPVDYKKMKSDAVKMKIGKLSIPVASIEDLIMLKEISGRRQDKEDIKALKKIKGYEKE